MKRLIQVVGFVASISAVGVAPAFAVLASEPVFNVGVVDPGTHMIESYVVCDVDYNTAVATLSAEEPHYPGKLLAIFDNDARFGNDPSGGICPAII